MLKGKHLQFVRVTPTTSFTPNPFGILEPTTYVETRAPQALDLVLVPLLAFDKCCQRLGFGGGYYDRTFAFKKIEKKPYLIGLAYEFQRLPHIPHNDFDICLDEVITEKRQYYRHSL